MTRQRPRSAPRPASREQCPVEERLVTREYEVLACTHHQQALEIPWCERTAPLHWRCTWCGQRYRLHVPDTGHVGPKAPRASLTAAGASSPASGAEHAADSGGSHTRHP